MAEAPSEPNAGEYVWEPTCGVRLSLVIGAALASGTGTWHPRRVNTFRTRLLCCAFVGTLVPATAWSADPTQSLALRGVVPKVVKIGLAPPTAEQALQHREAGEDRPVFTISGGSNAGPYQLLLQSRGPVEQQSLFAFDGRVLEFRDGTAQITASRTKRGVARQAGDLTVRTPDRPQGLVQDFLLVVRTE